MASIDAIALAARFVRALSFEPTADQRKAFEAIARLILTEEQGACLVLQGAAGTGKTSILRAVVDVLEEMEAHVAMLAPTGRAAKVLASRTQREASTLHKYLYDTEASLTGSVRYRPRRNSDPQDAVYIVDEASMIGEETDGGASLLHDLCGFVYGDEPTRKLILIGDPYQLPPIGALFSPALSASYLKRTYGMLAGTVQLKEVKRQAGQSIILENAVRLRQALDDLRETGDAASARPPLVNGDDCVWLPDAQSVVDIFMEHYDPDDPDSVVAICYSNGIAAQLNTAIRARLYDEPQAMMAGDRVMVVRNYYRQSFHQLPFIANGDIGFVTRTFQETLVEKFGQKWMEAMVAFQDLKGKVVDISTCVPVSLLEGKAPNLSYPEVKAIWEGRLEELAQTTEKKPDKKELKTDPYLGALQLKFGYTITGHKAQGGQWRNVIVVFEPYFVQKQTDEDPAAFLRWAYTAMTRASGKLFLFKSPFPEVGASAPEEQL